jgi:HK97 gp10 family phage protein
MSDPRVTIKGLAEFRVQMAELPAKMQRGALRTMMRDAMKVVRDDARANAPKLTKAVTKNGVPVRLPGTLRNAISVRTSKTEDKAGNVGVFVNVRPLKGNTYRKAGSYTTPQSQRRSRYLLTKKSQRGADNPRDPYFWRWIEFGTKARKTKSGKALGAVRPYKFLQGAADKLQAAADKFSANLQAWVAKANNTGRIE